MFSLQLTLLLHKSTFEEESYSLSKCMLLICYDISLTWHERNFAETSRLVKVTHSYFWMKTLTSICKTIPVQPCIKGNCYISCMHIHLNVLNPLDCIIWLGRTGYGRRAVSWVEWYLLKEPLITYSHDTILLYNPQVSTKSIALHTETRYYNECVYIWVCVWPLLYDH